MIKFTKIDKGIYFYLFGSDGQNASNSTLSKSVVQGGTTNIPIVGIDYQVSNFYDLVIIAHPTKMSKQTDFEFTYSQVGVQYPYYEQLFEHIKAQEDPEAYFKEKVIGYAFLIFFTGYCLVCLSCGVYIKYFIR